jgi:exonuclease SbcD
MKILHTADWHMNDTLGRVDRTEDIFAALTQIAAYLEEHRVDVMLVAGDLFSERSRPDQTRGAVARIKDTFLPFLKRGGTIVAIPGNHDSEIFFETMRDTLDLIALGESSVPGTQATGRLWMAARARLLKLADPQGQIVQFALMPYPTARAYLSGDNTSYPTIEAKHRAIQEKFVQALDSFRNERIDKSLPAVLVSHVHVRGAQTHNLYKISEVEDVVFEQGDIPTAWAYVAYGHIHLPHAPLSGAPHVRYCGSVVPLDFAERNDQKSVVLLEIGAEGLVGEPQILPLQSTPIQHIEIRDPQADVPGLKQQYEDQTPLVHYTLHWKPGRDNRDAICRELNSVFPRWYAREFVEIGRDDYGGLFESSGVDLSNVTQTVRDYLGEQLRQAANREEVTALAETLLAERDKELQMQALARAEAQPKTRRSTR